MDTLGERLKAARESRELTQAGVSKTLGLGANVLSEYERNKSGVSDERLLQFADLYGVDAERLAGRPVARARPDAFYDGILHALGAFNKTSGELIAEIQQWRERATAPPRREETVGSATVVAQSAASAAAPKAARRLARRQE